MLERPSIVRCGSPSSTSRRRSRSRSHDGVDLTVRRLAQVGVLADGLHQRKDTSGGGPQLQDKARRGDHSGDPIPGRGPIDRVHAPGDLLHEAALEPRRGQRDNELARSRTPAATSVRRISSRSLNSGASTQVARSARATAASESARMQSGSPCGMAAATPPSLSLSYNISSSHTRSGSAHPV